MITSNTTTLSFRSTSSYNYGMVRLVLMMFILPISLHLTSSSSSFLIMCEAVVAYPGLWTGRQPDRSGTGITSMLIGTAEYHYVVVETDDTNFPALRGFDDDMLYYATLGQDGRFIPTNLLVGVDSPEEHEWEKNKLEGQGQQDGPNNNNHNNNNKYLVSALQEKTHAIHAQCLMSDYCKWKAYQNQIQHEKSQHSQQDGKQRYSPVIVKSGSITNLVIPFRFANHDDGGDYSINGEHHPVSSIEDLDMKLFNGPHLTVRDYFLQQSYSKLEVVSEILPWITIPYTEEECAHRQSGLSRVMHTCLEAALEKALPVLNDGAALLDSPTTTLTFVHSGYAAEYGGNDPYGTWYEDRIWSHAWELATPLYQGRYALISDKYDRKNAQVNRVGVAVYELAQVLGAPTLHGEFPGYGLGYYDMMANPWGFDGTLAHCGSMSPYTKNLFGWLHMEEITLEGTYDLEESYSSNKVYVIRRGFPDGEYLILENRQEHGYDVGLSQPGLAIYHIDEMATDVGGSYPGRNNFPKDQYKVSLLQGDGRYDLERMEDEGDSGDLFHAGRFTGIGPYGVLLSDGSVDGSNGYPNTNSFRDGQERPTGIVIELISVPDKTMRFTVRFQPISRD